MTSSLASAPSPAREGRSGIQPVGGNPARRDMVPPSGHQRQRRRQPPQQGGSGWLPKIPRSNHLSDDERRHHLANVQARRQRDALFAHTLRSEADLREQRGRQAGPGVDLDELDRFSRERNISLLSRGQQRSTLRDLAFIEACRRQIKLIQANQFPPPHCSDHPAAALKPSYHPARPHRRRGDSKRALDASPNPMASEPPPTAHAAESAGTHAGADGTGTVAAAPSVSFADDVATAPVPSMSAADEIAAAVTSELLQAAIVSAAAPQEEGDAGGGGGGELQPPVGGSPGPGTGPARDDEGNAWESMKLGELRRLAGARGVSLDAIDDALDADAPKAALITLLQAC